MLKTLPSQRQEEILLKSVAMQEEQLNLLNQILTFMKNLPQENERLCSNVTDKLNQEKGLRPESWRVCLVISQTNL